MIRRALLGLPLFALLVACAAQIESGAIDQDPTGDAGTDEVGALDAGTADAATVDGAADAGFEDAGAADAGTEPSDASAPLAPANLRIVEVTASSVALAWVDLSNDETRFEIERRVGAASFAPLASLAAGSESHTDHGLAPRSSYTYRARACGPETCSAFSAEVTATTLDVPPAAPTSLTASPLSSSSVRLQWQDNSDNESAFVLEYRVSGTSAFGTLATAAANATSASPSGLAASTTFEFRVRAENAAGASAYSNTATATTQAPANATIVADHTAVALYDRIPAQYLAAVKSMLVDIAGESHSSGYRIGLGLLAQRDARFASTTFDGTIPAVASDRLRLGRHGSTGEEDFFTNAAAITTMKSLLTRQANAGNPIHVLGFGWCWDMTWHNNTSPSGSNARDPVYNVHWFGSSVGGPEGDLIWGLDDADRALTGNSVSLANYLAAVEEYRAHCAANGLGCQAIFTTGPVDSNGGTERGLQREIKHDAIRAYVQAHPGSILFDYADILAWSDAGAHNVVNWNDGGTLRPHAQIHSANAMDYDASWQPVTAVEDGDHIGEVGALRLGKAMWWLLARIAGWDGTPAP